MPGIIIHSGDWDRIYHGLSIASMYAFFEKKVVVFLTYWAVETIVKGEITSKEGKVDVIGEGIQKGI
ncbi:MAG: hypothetical protein H0Z28_11385 [Archaeoglobus sp.]|nr:hypothetical protein [Archaeoglobus sp.]